MRRWLPVAVVLAACGPRVDPATADGSGNEDGAGEGADGQASAGEDDEIVGAWGCTFGDDPDFVLFFLLVDRVENGSPVGELCVQGLEETQLAFEWTDCGLPRPYDVRGFDYAFTAEIDSEASGGRLAFTAAFDYVGSPYFALDGIAEPVTPPGSMSDLHCIEER